MADTMSKNQEHPEPTNDSPGKFDARNTWGFRVFDSRGNPKKTPMSGRLGPNDVRELVSALRRAEKDKS